MEVVRPEFVPDPARSREEMEALQREIAAAARFEDDHVLDTAGLREGCPRTTDGRSPLIAGVDQAFVGDTVVSAIVVSRDGNVVERAHAAVETKIPYVPGLLSFREGEAIIAAFDRLETSPDVALVDGSGRIHFREAGLATHVGVTLDLPTVGVAKRLLCGTVLESTDGGFPAGTRVAIEADGDYETVSAGTVVGYAVQTRQFEGAGRHVNPLYVSPGHRVSADTAADIVLATAAGYKLPEPTRLADAYADDLKGDVAE
jgi:deoxyribonuclease V